VLGLETLRNCYIALRAGLIPRVESEVLTTCHCLVTLSRCASHSRQSELLRRGFGGLEVACKPLVPKFAGLYPAEAVGFLGRKNPQHTFLRRGSKAVGPMS